MQAQFRLVIFDGILLFAGQTRDVLGGNDVRIALVLLGSLAQVRLPGFGKPLKLRGVDGSFLEARSIVGEHPLGTWQPARDVRAIGVEVAEAGLWLDKRHPGKVAGAKAVAIGVQGRVLVLPGNSMTKWTR